MRSLASLFTILVLLVGPLPVLAQPSPGHVDVEVEPIAFVLGGAGGHVGVKFGRWSYTVEVFQLTVPEDLHGNDGFEASPFGAELHVERSFGASRSGFYAGPEIGINRFTVTHRASGRQVERFRYSVGVRGGYRWYPGLGDLYLSPVAGLVYTLNSEAISIDGETFESGPVAPYMTVGLGWSF